MDQDKILDMPLIKTHTNLHADLPFCLSPLVMPFALTPSKLTPPKLTPSTYLFLSCQPPSPAISSLLASGFLNIGLSLLPLVTPSTPTPFIAPLYSWSHHQRPFSFLSHTYTTSQPSTPSLAGPNPIAHSNSTSMLLDFILVVTIDVVLSSPWLTGAF